MPSVSANPVTALVARSIRIVAMLALVAIVVAACGGDDDENDSPSSQLNPMVEGAPPSPGAGQGNPERVGELTLTIQNGAFDEDSFSTQVDEPTVVHIDNRDGTAYRVQFGDVVAPVEIAPSGVTDVSFTAPNATEGEGELLAADADTVVDTIQFSVQGPSGAT